MKTKTTMSIFQVKKKPAHLSCLNCEVIVRNCTFRQNNNCQYQSDSDWDNNLNLLRKLNPSFLQYRAADGWQVSSAWSSTDSSLGTAYQTESAGLVALACSLIFQIVAHTNWLKHRKLNTFEHRTLNTEH